MACSELGWRESRFAFEKAMESSVPTDFSVSDICNEVCESSFPRQSFLTDFHCLLQS